MASGNEIEDELNELPRERVIEVHVAGGLVKQSETGPVYVDAHERGIVDETWQMFEAMLPELPSVKAVCFECENVNENTVLTTLKRIRKMVQASSASQNLVATLDDAA